MNGVSHTHLPAAVLKGSWPKELATQAHGCIKTVCVFQSEIGMTAFKRDSFFLLLLLTFRIACTTRRAIIVTSAPQGFMG